MSRRFFVEPHIDSPQAVLHGPEAHHLAHVLRAKAGDEVVLFDGSGQEFAARVSKIGRDRIELDVLETRAVDRELPFRLTLAVALPKGDRQAWLVEKAVELGVSELIPLVTTRGVAQPVDKALERLRRGVIEASKQCGRNRLMGVAQPQSWSELIGAERSGQRYVAHPGGQAASLLSAPARPGASGQWSLAIGPEGGLTDEEVALALAAGWQTIGLGSRILRVETAAMALAAWLALGSA